MNEIDKKKVHLYLAVAIAIAFIAFFVGIGAKSCNDLFEAEKNPAQEQSIENNQNVNQNESLFIGCNGFF